MASSITRRGFLKGLAAGAMVVGFDPVRRSWITAANAEESTAASNFPTFSGSLHFDEATLTQAADDFGHIIHRQPVAVLKPADVNDIKIMVRFANRYGIKIGPRGQGHSSYGQMQALGGVVIDMSTLDTIHSITPTYADVDAGIKWRTVIEASLLQGLTPPVTTDYIELSVGGTLSVGGIGGVSYNQGLLVDNVFELQVVTGEGDIEWCSARKNRKLFEAVLAGLGQCAIIVRARVRLVQAHARARVFLLFYDDINAYMQDQITLITDERFNYVEGQVVADGAGGWRFMLEAAKYYDTAPNDAALLAGLSHNASETVIEDKTYFEFVNRLEATINFLKMIGVWEFPHPWFDVFLPASEAAGYVSNVLSTLTLDDTGQGPLLFYPVRRSSMTRPMFRAPDEDVVFLFDILRTAPPVQAVVDAMVAHNRVLFEQARAVGGTRYPMNAIPFSQDDWVQQFGAQWETLVKAKKKYDPNHTLTPGQGIF